MDLIANFMPSLGTAESGMYKYVRWNPYPGAPPTTWLLVVGRPQSNVFCFVSFYAGDVEDNL